MQRYTSIHLLVGLLTFCCSANAQFTDVDSAWRVADVGGGIKPSFDFGPDGSIHVMGMTELFVGEVWHAQAQSIDGPWTPTTLSNGYFYGPGDLRVDSTGKAHIAYHDHDAQDAAHFTVSGNNNTQTIAVTPDTHDGWDNSIALTSTDEVRMSSIFPSAFGASESLVIAELEGDAWASEAVNGSGAAMYGLNSSITVDSQDRSHVVYTLADDWAGPGSINYVTQNPTGRWLVDTIESGINVGRFASIEVDQNDTVHAAWINVHTDDLSKADVRYATLTDQWNIETVATLDNVLLGFSNARKLVSLDIDSQGNPHLAYGDRDSVTYATKGANLTWEQTEVVSTDDAILNGLVVLRLDPDDDPGIAFWRPVAGPSQGIVSLAMFDDVPISQLGDFDNDGFLTAADLDLLKQSVGSADLRFDLNGDAGVDLTDHEFWVTDVFETLLGDANLDKRVDFADFLLVSQNFGQDGDWADGNFDGLGGVDFSDFLYVSNNFGESAAAVAVPEPVTSCMCFQFLLLVGCIARTRSRPVRPS